MAAELGESLTEHSKKWRETLERCIPCCMVIKITAARAFDTDAANSSTATGFVVDKRLGLVLTNRHVVKPGPVTSEAVLLNREEIPLKAVYRDPVHDFGFYRFDPANVKYMTLSEIELAPEAATIGQEVRVVGNDSGEKVSILSGTLARLDRDAPNYGSGKYNDFNTFYIHTASGTKGGSSGSPVLDIEGRAVALNAGSKSGSSAAFFLPLHRVVRVLKTLQAAGDRLDPSKEFWPLPAISRGTIQTIFKYKGFEDIRRLGLKQDTEQYVRQQLEEKRNGTNGSEGAATSNGKHNAMNDTSTGMLAVDLVVPGGPAAGSLAAGDVLVQVNGCVVTTFLELEELLDTNVGQTVTFELERGGQDLKCEIVVQDLHSITPNQFLEVCDGVVHSLSYQQACSFLLPTGLVYVASGGYALSRAMVPRHAIIQSLNHEPTPTLVDFARILGKLEHGARVPLQFYTHGERKRPRTVVFTVERQWYLPETVYTRNDGTGLWERAMPRDIWPPQVSKEAESGSIETKRSDVDMKDAPIKAQPDPIDPIEDVQRALVFAAVDVARVCLTDGVHAESFEGTGLVVQHEVEAGLGYVALDRNTVPIAQSDILLSFAAHPEEVKASVALLHPTRNLVLVKYDPSELSKAAATAIKAAPCEAWGSAVPATGCSLTLLSLSYNLRVVRRAAIVVSGGVVFSLPIAAVPRFRPMNEEVLELDLEAGAPRSGVLVDSTTGAARALWVSYAAQTSSSSDDQITEVLRGLPIDLVLEALEDVQKARESGTNTVVTPILEAELEPVALARSRALGLPEETLSQLHTHDPQRNQVLTVKGTTSGTHAAEVLQPGDMITSVDGHLTCGLPEVERWVRVAAAEQRAMQVSIIRQRDCMEVMVEPTMVDARGTVRTVQWAGCIIQEPHHVLAEQGLAFTAADGLGDTTRLPYICRWFKGSPASRYGLYALHWILEVNSQPVRNLDDFLKVTGDIGHGESCRVKVVHVHGKPKMVTLVLDLHYWPTLQLRMESGKWVRETISKPVLSQQGY